MKLCYKLAVRFNEFVIEKFIGALMAYRNDEKSGDGENGNKYVDVESVLSRLELCLHF